MTCRNWIHIAGAAASIVTCIGWAHGADVKALRPALTFHASFDRGTDADFALGDRKIYTATSYKKREDAAPGIGNPDVAIASGQGRHGSALKFSAKNTKAIYYQGERNVAWSGGNWSGTVSFWLSLDPNLDLAPGFCDPIQLTDKDYNDSAIWVDFTKDDKPRHFRLGVFGVLESWNPEKLNPDKNPAFLNRLVVVKSPPFARGQWTHVAVAYSGLGSSQSGTAKLYLNGKLQGTAEGIREPFKMEPPRTAIRLGLNYTGLFDDVSLFSRPLSGAEVETLYRLPKGAAGLR